MDNENIEVNMGNDMDQLQAMFGAGEEVDNDSEDNIQDGSEEDLDLDIPEEEEFEEEEDPDAQSEDVEYELNVNGKIEKIKHSELIANAQKYKAADKKFEEAANIRKDAEAKLAHIPQQQEMLRTVLEHYTREAQAMMQGTQPDWEYLAANDPAEFVRQQYAWNNKQAQLNQAQQAKQLLDQHNQKKTNDALMEHLTAERNKAIDAVPEWKDPKKAVEGAKAIDSYLESQGIPVEIRGSIDSTAVLLIARKAMLYDQALAKQKERSTVKPAQVRNQRPTASNAKPTQSQAQRAKSAKAFNANPSVDSLAAFFE
jgi:hypothetical protein